MMKEDETAACNSAYQFFASEFETPTMVGVAATFSFSTGRSARPVRCLDERNSFHPYGNSYQKLISAA